MSSAEIKKSKIELRSEEVNDILGQIPHWSIRWGMIMLLVLLSLILLGSWWFKYPDIVPATIHVTTENPPYNAIARSDGKIKTLLVSDNQKVEAGTILAIIENPAVFEDVQLLTGQLDEFRDISVNLDANTNYSFNDNLVLGEIQAFYAEFLKLYNDLLQYFRLDYHNQKINSLRQEISKYRDYSKRLANQSRILKQEEAIATGQFRRDSMLFRQAVIPEADYEVSKSKLLQKQYASEQARITQASNDIQISKLEQEILDLELKRNEENGKHISLTLEANNKLVAAIADWKQKYVLRSSVDGTVSFTRIWSENQNVRAGDPVMSVIPQDAGRIIGKISLSLAGSGKVKEGQKVNIRFSGYPYLEYGMVKGIIRSISLVTADNAYSVVVDLPEGLRTSYNLDLKFSQDMQGQAEIITSDKRLIEKIVNPVRSVLSRQKQL